MASGASWLFAGTTFPLWSLLCQRGHCPPQAAHRTPNMPSSPRGLRGRSVVDSSSEPSTPHKQYCRASLPCSDLPVLSFLKQEPHANMEMRILGTQGDNFNEFINSYPSNPYLAPPQAICNINGQMGFPKAHLSLSTSICIGGIPGDPRLQTCNILLPVVQAGSAGTHISPKPVHCNQGARRH